LGPQAIFVEIPEEHAIFLAARSGEGLSYLDRRLSRRRVPLGPIPGSKGAKTRVPSDLRWAKAQSRWENRMRKREGRALLAPNVVVVGDIPAQDHGKLWLGAEAIATASYKKEVNSYPEDEVLPREGWTALTAGPSDRAEFSAGGNPRLPIRDLRGWTRSNRRAYTLKPGESWSSTGELIEAPAPVPVRPQLGPDSAYLCEEHKLRRSAILTRCPWCK